jgi:tRNA uridine 5-carbamoylmethylation protein Kti12
MFNVLMIFDHKNNLVEIKKTNKNIFFETFIVPEKEERIITTIYISRSTINLIDEIAQLTRLNRSFIIQMLLDSGLKSLETLGAKVI